MTPKARTYAVLVAASTASRACIHGKVATGMALSYGQLCCHTSTSRSTSEYFLMASAIRFLSRVAKCSSICTPTCCARTCISGTCSTTTQLWQPHSLIKSK